MTEKIVLGQAQRILVNATSDIWHRISSWTHASDVEMPDGTPLNTYLTDMNDELNTKLDEKYGSLPDTITDIRTLDAIPDLTYGRLHTVASITAGKYTIPTDHYLYSYSGSHPKTIQRFAVLIDTTDLTKIVMYIADKSIENRWTLTKIATQDQIDNLQQQINDLSTEFNNLNLFVQQSIGGLNQLYQIIQNQMDWLEEQLAELQEQVNDLLNELRDFKKAINGRVDSLEKLLQGLYGEVGSIYLTTSSSIQGKMVYEYLEECFGGKWVLVSNAYLYAGGFNKREGEYSGNIPYRPDIPGEDNYRASDTFSMTFSGGENSEYARKAKDRLGRDYSQIFYGEDEVSLSTENLPPHIHWFGDNDRDRLLGCQVRYDVGHAPYATVAIPGDGFVIQADGNAVYWKPDRGTHLILSESSHIVPGPNGSIGGSSWAQTRNNDLNYTMKSEPFFVEPTRFKVFVYVRITK